MGAVTISAPIPTMTQSILSPYHPVLFPLSRPPHSRPHRMNAINEGVSASLSTFPVFNFRPGIVWTDHTIAQRCVVPRYSP